MKMWTGRGNSTCVLNSMLIGMYKGNVLGFMCAHIFMRLDIFERTTFSRFEHTSCFSRKSPQVFVHEILVLADGETKSFLSTAEALLPQSKGEEYRVIFGRWLWIVSQCAMELFDFIIQY